MLQKLGFLIAATLAADHSYVSYADIGGKRLNALGGLDALPRGFGNYQQPVYTRSGASAKVLDTRFHIHNKDILFAQQEMGYQVLKEDALGAIAAGSTLLDLAHTQQCNPFMLRSKLVRDILDARIQLEEASRRSRLCPGTFLYEFSHLAEGNNAIRRGKSQAGCQSRIRIRIDHQNSVTSFHKGGCQQRADRCLSYSTFAGYRYFHTYIIPLSCPGSNTRQLFSPNG